MGEIIDLDAVVPEDMVFKFRGKEWTLPGDIDVDTVVTLLRITNGLAKAEGLLVKDAATGERWPRNDQQQRRYSRELANEYLKLFKVNHPELEELPFKDMAALSTIHATVLTTLGFSSQENNDRPLDRAGTTKKQPKKATSLSRSPRSSTRRGKRST